VIVRRVHKSTAAEGQRCRDEAARFLADFTAAITRKMLACPEAVTLKAGVNDFVKDRDSAALVRQELSLVNAALLTGDPTALAKRRLEAKATLDVLSQREHQRGQDLFALSEKFKATAAELHRQEQSAQVAIFEKEEADPSTSDSRMIVVSEVLATLRRGSPEGQALAKNLSDDILAPTLVLAAPLGSVTIKPDGITDAQWTEYRKHHETAVSLAKMHRAGSP
jgi:hypothetical protein